MRAPISIVIPTLNAASGLSHCLGSLCEGLESGLIREVIVSDGGSNDDTVQIADDAGCNLVTSDPGRGGQLRRGAEMAGGDWLLFLHADSWLLPGWGEQVAKHIATSQNAGVFALEFRAGGPAAKWVAGWANFRTRHFSLPYGDQGLLISRTLYDQTGGFPAIPLMEDVVMARALKGKITPIPQSISTAADKYLHDGWLRRSVANGVLMTRFLCGADPVRLAKSYTKRR